MAKVVVTALHVLAFLALGTVAFAAEGGVTLDAETGKDFFFSFGGLVSLAAAVSIGFAAGGCGAGQGAGLCGACSGIARNPEAGKQIMTTMILGFAIIESLAIYGLVISLILLYANPFM